MEQHWDRASATEAALITQVGLGDEQAFDTLAARHRGAVTLLAHVLDPGRRHPGLVDEVFDVAHGNLRLMLGPSESLRPYLLLLTRRLFEEHPDGAPDDPLETEHFVSDRPFGLPLAGEAHPAVAVEFSRLPEAWQLLVWMLEVEGAGADEAAGPIGVSPVVVPALVAGARAALRQALLLRHRSRTLPAACLGHTLRLGRSPVRPVPRVVLRHAAQCERCVVLVDDLTAVERDLGVVLARHLLGRAADDYLTARRAAADGSGHGSESRVQSRPR